MAREARRVGIDPCMTRMDWITDRRPTEADGDVNGNVLLRIRPTSDACSYCHFSLVGEGSHWCHTAHWQPANPASEPQPQPGPAPAPEPQLDVRVGQAWRCRNGTIAMVTKDDGSDVPFQIGGFWYRRNGQFHSNSPRPEYDLVELIQDAPRPVPEVSLQLADEPEPERATIPEPIRAGAAPFYVVVLSDDNPGGRGGGEPIVWEHPMPRSTTLQAALERQQQIGSRYGTTFIAECRIVPRLTREVPADA